MRISRAACTVGLAALTLAQDVFASFGGSLGSSPELFFIGAAIVSIPGGIACLVAEWIGAKRRPPMWFGVVALALGLFALGCVMFVPPHRTASAMFLFLLPPLMTLALVSLLPAPVFRVVVAWLVSFGAIGLIVMVRAPHVTPDQARELTAGLFGGALTHMLLWHLGFVLGQGSRRSAGMAPAPEPDVRAILHKGATTLRVHGPEIAGVLRLHPGFWWWIGGAAVFYVAVAVVSTRLEPTLLQSAIIVCYRIRGLLGVPWTNVPGQTFAQMWLTDGVFLSAVVGAGVWGLAGLLRRFDAGCLAPLRLVAIALVAIMAVWVSQQQSDINRIVEAERRAVYGR